MNKEILIEVFENTVLYVNSNSNFREVKTTKHNVFEIENIEGGDIFPNVKTINSDTVSAAKEYSKLGKTCILNMASAKKPGGGVINGAKAQEECLFRCSNLFTSVTKEFYPIKMDEALYTKDVTFFKDKDYNLMDQVVVDVVTIPALNLNSNAKYDDLDVFNNYDKIMRDKISLMLYLAHINNCENIILGAWGCGVFKNNPVVIAELFGEIISKEYPNSFKNIIFAVINDHNSAGDNYTVFSKHFGN